MNKINRNEEFILKVRELVKEYYPDYRESEIKVDAPKHNYEKNDGIN